MASSLSPLSKPFEQFLYCTPTVTGCCMGGCRGGGGNVKGSREIGL
ncbi:MAG: hypothetical protein HC924_10480 [Synechococcaceae cyanobacterium SM2_3_2]|nr:hypothetical protein [Synechococcaceae cyanobacterium SM2_3_2]